ncbi:hypothetical protein [Microbaculum marinisediminis]|uniref:Uncharacterized protein n=1 Tax=Microbaculum marinisediminis TaxID=2931392 RepID=A0AAW5QVI0_9HYPH|nr:hypothetical protein [Microbaculum sp. A6E488]MCT8971688.1 hypothetical protein [Microbaculum sp. A6E488]
MKNIPEKFEDILKQEYRRPKKGDRLLRGSDDWTGSITFSKQPLTRHVHLWDGFLSAADGLIELCTRPGCEHERHSVIYPILFNYRHGLELAMKWTIVMYSGQGLNGIDDKHNLWKLWKTYRKILEKAGSADKESIQAVEQIVKDFHDLDEGGIAFRYGWSLEGKEIKLPDYPIDLADIREVMEGVAHFFDGTDGWLSDLASAEPDT